MSIIQKLWWFFKLEKRRYLVGIVALVLVSVHNHWGNEVEDGNQDQSHNPD